MSQRIHTPVWLGFGATLLAVAVLLFVQATPVSQAAPAPVASLPLAVAQTTDDIYDPAVLACEADAPTLLGEATTFEIEIEDEDLAYQALQYDFDDGSPLTVTQRITGTDSYSVTYTYTQTGEYTATVLVFNDLIYENPVVGCEIPVAVVEEIATPDDIDDLVLMAEADTRRANGRTTTELTAYFVDEDDEVVILGGQPITFATSLGSFVPTGQITPALTTVTAETNGAGRAIVSLVSDVISGTAEITATAMVEDEDYSDTTEVAFVKRGSSASVALAAGAGGFIELDGDNVRIEVPVGLFDEDVELIGSQFMSPFGEDVFQPGIYDPTVGLDYYLTLFMRADDGKLLEKFTSTVTITIDLEDVLSAEQDLNNVRLYYWDGIAWVDPTSPSECDAETCGFTLNDNMLIVRVDHFSDFGLVDVQQFTGPDVIYLPFVRRTI